MTYDDMASITIDAPVLTYLVLGVVAGYLVYIIFFKKY
jgi:hypothetical protein